MSEDHKSRTIYHDARALEDLAAMLRRTPGHDPADQVATVRMVQRSLDRYIVGLVVKLAIDRQYNWTRIGLVLGISRQAAVKRYGSAVSAERARHPHNRA